MGSLPQALVGRFSDPHSCLGGETRAVEEWLEARGVPWHVQGVCLVTPEMLCDVKNNDQ